MKELSFEKMECISGGKMALFFKCAGIFTVANTGALAVLYTRLGCTLVSAGLDWD
jgi:hypothetical protein